MKVEIFLIFRLKMTVVYVLLLSSVENSGERSSAEGADSDNSSLDDDDDIDSDDERFKTDHIEEV